MHTPALVPAAAPVAAAAAASTTVDNLSRGLTLEAIFGGAAPLHAPFGPQLPRLQGAGGLPVAPMMQPPQPKARLPPGAPVDTLAALVGGLPPVPPVRRPVSPQASTAPPSPPSSGSSLSSGGVAAGIAPMNGGPEHGLFTLAALSSAAPLASLESLPGPTAFPCAPTFPASAGGDAAAPAAATGTS
jgi:hypothetical protein